MSSPSWFSCYWIIDMSKTGPDWVNTGWDQWYIANKANTASLQAIHANLSEEWQVDFDQWVKVVVDLLSKQHQWQYNNLLQIRRRDTVRGKVLQDMSMPDLSNIITNLCHSRRANVIEWLRILSTREEPFIIRIFQHQESIAKLAWLIDDIHLHNLNDNVQVPFQLDDHEIIFGIRALHNGLELQSTQEARFLFEILADHGILGTLEELRQAQDEIDKLEKEIAKKDYRKSMSRITMFYRPMQTAFLIARISTWRPLLMSLIFWIQYTAILFIWQRVTQRIQRAQKKRKKIELEKRSQVIHKLINFTYCAPIPPSYDDFDQLETEELMQILEANNKQIASIPDTKTKQEKLTSIQKLFERQGATAQDIETILKEIEKTLDNKHIMPMPTQLVQQQQLNFFELRNKSVQELLALWLNEKEALELRDKIAITIPHKQDDTLDLNSNDMRTLFQSMVKPNTKTTTDR